MDMNNAFQLELSNSPLPEAEKQNLALQIQKMHGESCRERGWSIPIQLESFRFRKACVSDRILLSTAMGNTPDEVLRYLEYETSGLLVTYPHFILNIVCKKSPTLEEFEELMTKFESAEYVWGFCINEKAPVNFTMELIAYE